MNSIAPVIISREKEWGMVDLSSMIRSIGTARLVDANFATSAARQIYSLLLQPEDNSPRNINNLVNTIVGFCEMRVVPKKVFALISQEIMHKAASLDTASVALVFKGLFEVKYYHKELFEVLCQRAAHSTPPSNVSTAIILLENLSSFSSAGDLSLTLSKYRKACKDEYHIYIYIYTYIYMLHMYLLIHASLFQMI